MKKAWTALVLTVTLSLGLAAPAAAAGSFADVPPEQKSGISMPPISLRCGMER